MGNIRVIGPKGSGKTTYLAALAYWPELKAAGGKAKTFNIQPLNDDTKQLADRAEAIILEGESLEPTVLGEAIQNVNDLPDYSFKIEIKRWLNKSEDIVLNVRDYPGEIFDELDSEQSSPLHEEFIDECLMKDVAGCLILLADWKPSSDKFYSRVMKKFTDLMDKHERSQDLRIAVAMSKCERGELWPGRLEPEMDLFELHLPKTQSVLRDKIPAANLQFHAISTFGVLARNDPRPNRTDEIGGHGSILRQPSVWNPYGMFAPLYWLSKGKRMSSHV